MIDPFYSPKVAAYCAVLNKLQKFRLKRGIFADNYTRMVNREIDGIKSRLNAALKRVQGAEGIQKMCAADPAFAKRWQEIKLQTGYINAIKREHELEKKLSELWGDQDARS